MLSNIIQKGGKILVPKKMFLTKGIGMDRAELRSFEFALRDAGIEKCNLVRVSSILPPKCEIIEKEEGLKEITPGMLTFCVMARCCSNEPHRLMAASIGIAVPSDNNAYGYLSEHHGYGESDKSAGDTSEDLAVSMLASTLGMDIDENKAWDDRRQEYRFSDKIVQTSSITQSGIVESSGKYCTVIATAVFLF
ncbi:MAG: arginine decarboxylase, pyruvoyl-dependent [Candidatus Omnitrophica bacterium]|nr:arginine decarboxylase, pyruvoyl-dependent [Candidatus Omnitrophota bacterium]